MAVAEKFDRQLKALSDPARRRIIALLKSKGACSCELISSQNSGVCVCDLQSQLGLTQPTITHHVKVLRQAGLVTTRKMRRWLYCCRNEAALDALGNWLRRL